MRKAIAAFAFHMLSTVLFQACVIIVDKNIMSDKEIATGVVHSVPEDLRRALTADRAALAQWEAITPLARNEWICWVEEAKKPETRRRRIERVCTELKGGVHRPCCWAGCPHRGKKWSVPDPSNLRMLPWWREGK